MTDATAAGGSALWNKDFGASKIAPALANPANRFERTFTANANTAYRVWVRMKAQNNSLSNDSLHLQFDQTIDSLKTPVARIGTTSSLEFVLQRGASDTSVSGWGWTDNGWGSPGVAVYFSTTGTQTVRVQQREDGPTIDQIVLTPDMGFVPGPSDNDTTILPATGSTGGPTACSAPTISPTSQDFASAGAGSGTVAVTADASCSWSALSNTTWLSITGANSGTGSGTLAYATTENTGSARSGTLTVAGQVFTVTQAGAIAPGPGASTTEVVLRAADAPTIVGAWVPNDDPTAAGGRSLLNPNAGAAKISTPSYQPADYVELAFDAEQGVPYHLWMRGKATGNSWANDSVYVQFDKTVDISGNPIYRIGTNDGTQWTLEDCTSCGLSGWGWQDNGSTGTIAEPLSLAQTGPQRIRIQVREDGLALDLIVLSSAKYLNSSPGTVKNDTNTQP